MKEGISGFMKEDIKNKRFIGYTLETLINNTPFINKVYSYDLLFTDEKGVCHHRLVLIKEPLNFRGSQLWRIFYETAIRQMKDIYSIIKHIEDFGDLN